MQPSQASASQAKHQLPGGTEARTNQAVPLNESLNGGPEREYRSGEIHQGPVAQSKHMLPPSEWEDKTVVDDDQLYTPAQSERLSISATNDDEFTIAESPPEGIDVRQSLGLIPAPTSARLVATIGADQGREFSLQGDSVSIGRSLDNDIVLTDIAVSRRHLAIARVDAEYIVTDSHSGNGTIINQQSLRRRHTLTHGDKIEIGNTVLRFERVPPPTSAVEELSATDDQALYESPAKVRDAGQHVPVPSATAASEQVPANLVGTSPLNPPAIQKSATSLGPHFNPSSNHAPEPKVLPPSPQTLRYPQLVPKVPQQASQLPFNATIRPSVRPAEQHGHEYNRSLIRAPRYPLTDPRRVRIGVLVVIFAIVLLAVVGLLLGDEESPPLHNKTNAQGILPVTGHQYIYTAPVYVTSVQRSNIIMPG